ncbi:hypothetical protein [Paenibacillus tengchongensis]|uniref:hypothetical protein n=1 Tax=Paenibacillus tengchongensis TaxID=2608684 RepID=UPI00124CE7DD|nr:hypothetical protein [Paenibacillus tengchongensis]
MAKLGRFVLELLRIMVLLALVLVLLGNLESGLFSMLYGRETSPWLFAAGNLLLFLVLYRNKLQFGGWYRPERNVKLKPVTAAVCIGASLLLILLPFAAPHIVYPV